LIYVEPVREENVAWHFDSGRLASTFYGDPSIRMRFSDDGLPAPSVTMLRSGKVIILKYLEGHLFDITTRRFLERLDSATYRIRDHWEKGNVVCGGTVYPLRAAPCNPADNPIVFRSDLALRDSARETLALAQGTTYLHPLPALMPGTRLRVGAAPAGPLSEDVVVAELRMQGPEGERRLCTFNFEPSLFRSGQDWQDRTLDLDGMKEGSHVLKLLVLSALSQSGRPAVVQWSPVELVPPQSQNLRLPDTETPPQPRDIVFSPSSIRSGQSVRIQVEGGEGMEVDCQYSLNSVGPPKTVYGWLSTDRMGCQTLVVKTPGHYVITAIRNSLRADWVPIHREWDCLP